jgi:hypothetical protein
MSDIGFFHAWNGRTDGFGEVGRKLWGRPINAFAAAVRKRGES